MNRDSDALHLGPAELAAYLDRTLSAEHRATVEDHLAWCDECRREFRDINSILCSARPKRRRLARIGPVVAAAAAIILLIAVPRGPSPSDSDLEHRDVPVILDQRPGIGAATPAPGQPGAYLLNWSPVERADRYRVSIFDATGTVAWRTETRDTSAILPPSAGLSSDSRYLWRVDARVGIDRWVESTLAPLVLGEVIEEPVIQEPMNREPAP
ncbi:MAG: zf-HC2 domain-containing protein [Gemmatimonadetes bacterium]|nr:zf-HC2 domain-containing protein [Gemmatimonadota bacterium]